MRTIGSGDETKLISPDPKIFEEDEGASIRSC